MLKSVRSYPRTRLSGSLLDSHVYVCRRSVLDVLQEKPHLDSIREESIPWLCKIQYSRSKRAKFESSKLSLSFYTTAVSKYGSSTTTIQFAKSRSRFPSWYRRRRKFRCLTSKSTSRDCRTQTRRRVCRSGEYVTVLFGPESPCTSI